MPLLPYRLGTIFWMDDKGKASRIRPPLGFERLKFLYFILHRTLRPSSEKTEMRKIGWKLGNVRKLASHSSSYKSLLTFSSVVANDAQLSSSKIGWPMHSTGEFLSQVSYDFAIKFQVNVNFGMNNLKKRRMRLHLQIIFSIHIAIVLFKLTKVLSKNLCYYVRWQVTIDVIDSNFSKRVTV